MGAIVPAILVETHKELEEKLALISGVVDTVQIDVVDGLFAETSTWPYARASDIKDFENLVTSGEMIFHIGKMHTEVDLMVNDVENIAESWVTLGASRVTLHTKDIQNISTILERLSKRLGYEKGFATDMLSIGVAFESGDDVSILEPIINKVDYVQFMGIDHIGRQGESFDNRVVSKVREFHSKHPCIPIQVDGGVSLTTAPELLLAGVSTLVIGSAIWYSTNVRERVKEFQDIASKFGRYS